MPERALGADSSLMRLVADEELSGSNDYRQILLQRALRGEGLALFGMRESPLGAGIESGGVGVSIDNAYLAVAAEWGYVGGAGLALVGLAVAYVLLRQPRGPWALVPAVALANFVGLGAVAIFTQTEFWLWMLVGGAAAAYAVARADEEVAARPPRAGVVAPRRSPRP